jgi:putative flippase GtrA
MDSFLKKIRSLLTREVVLYVVFGVLTTVVNYVVFVGLDLLFGEHTLLWSGTVDLLVWKGAVAVEFWILSNVVAFVAAVAFAFVTNRNIVFRAGTSTGDRKADRANLFRQSLLFWGARIVSLGVEYGILFVLIGQLGIQDFYAKIASNVVVVIVNYFFSKFIVFASPKRAAAGPAGG